MDGLGELPCPRVRMGDNQIEDITRWLDQEELMPKQGTEEWVHLRSDIVTASVAADIVLPYGATKDVMDHMFAIAEEVDGIELRLARHHMPRSTLLNVKKGLITPPNPTPMMLRGQLEEHLIQQVLRCHHSHANSLDIYVPLRCRMLNKWLLASPDGCFTSPVRLLEIKSIQRRRPEPGKIPHKYYLQVQIQLHVYGAKLCEYVEAKVKYLDTYVDYVMCTNERKNIAFHENGDAKKVFTRPYDWSQSMWENYIVNTIIPDLNTVWTVLFYELVDFQALSITYNQSMVEGILPHLYAFYKEIHCCPDSVPVCDKID